MKKYNVTVNGTVYEVEIEEVAEFAGNAAPVAPAATPAPNAAAPAPKAAAPKAAPAAAGGKAIKAPMPGTIVGVNVTVGQKVAKGTVVAILEAMKMENEIFAAEGGTVVAINAPQGSSVNSGDAIVTLG